MARTLIRGWEFNDATLDGGLTGAGATIDSGTVRSGSFALKIAAASGTNTRGGATGAFGQYFARIYVRVTARPSTTARHLLGGVSNIAVKLNADGTLEYLDGGVSVGTSSTALTDTTKWYLVEWRGGTVASGPLLKIDGVTEVSGSITGKNIEATVGANDTVADTYTAYFDDFVADDADWVGSGKVLLALPVSDNAVGTGWQKPGGATTNLFSSVDNTPPVGIADSTSSADAEKQIRNASSNSADYVANLPSYTTLGIVTGDVVTGLQAIVITGAPTSTGAKTGQLVLTNPSQTTDHNNYHSGSNAGTYPTGWKITRGAILSNPSVTLATQPTLTSDIDGGTASRIAMVCFMGLSIDYTPVVASVPGATVVRQAVPRAAYR